MPKTDWTSFVLLLDSLKKNNTVLRLFTHMRLKSKTPGVPVYVVRLLRLVVVLL